MAEYRMCLYQLVQVSLEFVTAQIQKVWWTLLSYDFIDLILSYFQCDKLGETVVHQVVIKRKSNEAKQTTNSSSLTLIGAKGKATKAAKWTTIQYLMKNKFLRVQLSPLQYLVQSCRFLHGVNCFSLCIWLQNQEVQEMYGREQNPILSVTRELALFKGQYKGGFKCKLSNSNYSQAYPNPLNHIRHLLYLTV